MLPLGAYWDIIREMLTPNVWVHSVLDVHPDSLVAQGFSAVFLDVDNTLLAYSQHRLGLQHSNWISGLKAAGLQVYLLSNNSKKNRIQRIATQLGVKGAYFACKPLSYSITALANREGIDLGSSVLIGDQIGTDIALGNWARMHTILVEPIAKNELLIKSIQHSVERSILKVVAPNLRLR